MKKVGIVMGSDSDMPVAEKAIERLQGYGVPYEVHIYSAHRTPEEAKTFAQNAEGNTFGVNPQKTEVTMTFTDKTCREFVQAAATADPIPGGGSVAALVGALGAALSNMVGALTLSSKKYIAVEAEMKKNIQEIHKIKEDLIDLVQKDIDNFEPLAKLYKMKSDDPEEKKRIREAKQKALYEACLVPMEIIKKCGRAIELSQEFAVKGNKVVIADSGSSAVLCKAAMQAASFNIYINTNMMKDKELAHKINGETAQRIVYYGALADSVFGYTTNTLMNTVIETGDTI